MRERTALLDGNVAIESTPGRGTQVIVYIPIPKPTAVPVEAAEPSGDYVL